MPFQFSHSLDFAIQQQISPDNELVETHKLNYSTGFTPSVEEFRFSKTILNDTALHKFSQQTIEQQN